jgi:hypothetical protein
LFSAHRIALGVRWVFKRIGEGFPLALAEVGGGTRWKGKKKKHNDSSKPAIDVAKYKIVGDEEKEKGKQAQ